MRALAPALAILVVAGGLAGLLAGVTPGDDVAGKYPDAAEIPTDGRRVEALGLAPLGALGAALQLVVVLACPSICLGMGFLQRSEGCRRWADQGVEKPVGQDRG